jgi:hypothetical protein
MVEPRLTPEEHSSGHHTIHLRMEILDQNHFCLCRAECAHEAGHTLRRGDFFTYDPTGRLPAEKIFESALLKCRNEPREKKAQFLGNLFANAVFTDVAPDDVHAVLRIAERLTYRQICVLALVGKHGEYHADEVKDAKRLEDEIVINELFELGIYKLNLLTVSDALPQGERKQALAPVGRMCFDLMSLQDASEKDLCKLADLLKAIERNPESNVSR